MSGFVRIDGLGKLSDAVVLRRELVGVQAHEGPLRDEIDALGLVLIADVGTAGWRRRHVITDSFILVVLGVLQPALARRCQARLRLIVLVVAVLLLLGLDLLQSEILLQYFFGLLSSEGAQRGVVASLQHLFSSRGQLA